MADTYPNYQTLSENEVEGVDYQIVSTPRSSTKSVIAIRGGGIETGTSEIVVDIAGSTYSSYLFEGLKSSGNGDLHITSTRFDEPKGLALVASSARCLSIHGYSDTVKNTKIGGADIALKTKVRDELIKAGFTVEMLPENDPLAGTDPDNIVNKCTSKAGVQLELSTAQRTQEREIKCKKVCNAVPSVK